jgi:hypothetical protein
MRLFRIFLPLLMLIISIQVKSQQSKIDSAASLPFFYGFYGYQWPGADMAVQFGSNSAIGPGFMWKTKSNWLFGAEYDFMFGNHVKNGMDILEGLVNSDGNIISGDGTPAVVALFERANSGGIKFGKLFPVSKKNKNSGIFFTLGTGYISHKVRIDVENESVPSLRGDYKRGYDRLSGGLMLSQSIGLLYFGKSRLLNIMFSVEAYEAWTHPYRDYYFDTMAPPPDGTRMDLLIGPKVAWVIPLRQRGVKEYFYY